MCGSLDYRFLSKQTFDCKWRGWTWTYFSYIGYLGENADEKFIDFINDITPYCNSILRKYKPLIITKEIENFKLSATNCYLCKIIFTSNADKIYDHDHISGCLIGITCNKCNLNRRRQTNIDVFAHNFKNYDGHFILTGLSKSKTCDLND